jgi:hypothetical protein
MHTNHAHADALQHSKAWFYFIRYVNNVNLWKHAHVAGKQGFSWAKLFERASNLNFVMAVANRSLEIMLYPLDLLAGKKYIETEERAVAIEKKKRAQVGSTAKGSPSRATEGKTALRPSPHLEHALANSVRSIYYSSITDEALRFAKMKKEWHDPDFPPEPTSLCSSCTSSSSSSSSPFSNRLRSLPVSWQQLRHTNRSSTLKSPYTSRLRPHTLVA